MRAVPQQIQLFVDSYTSEPGMIRTSGGSAGAPDARKQGGGSRHVYTDSKSPVKKRGARAAAAPPADPRLIELRALGLNRTLMEMAERIGYEAFMAAWEVLSNSDEVQSNGCRLLIPAISTYMRYQRNLLIVQLAAEGKRPPQIAHEVNVSLGMNLTVNLVKRALAEHYDALHGRN